MSLRRVGYPLGSITENYYKENQNSDARNVVHMKGLLYNWTQADILQTMADHIEELVNPYRSRPKKVADYLYEIEYSDYDYEDGYKYMEDFGPDKLPGLCSGIRRGSLAGRNFDWYYNENANFVVRTKATAGRHATIGACLADAPLTNEFIDSGKESDAYRYLPFKMHDIINDAHVYVSDYVVYAGDKGYTYGTNPGKKRMCQLMIPRYIADYASSAREGIEMLKDFDIFSPIKSINEEIHFMICDLENSYIVEFINNEMKVFSDTDEDFDNFPNGKCIMTNFYLDGWNGEIKTVYAGDTEEEARATGMNAHAMGVERYQYMLNNYNMDIEKLMESIKYTKTYDLDLDPFWYSEMTGLIEGYADLTIYTPKEKFNPVIDIMQELYKKHERNNTIWFTTHTGIYDIENLKLNIFVEEDYKHKYEFKLKPEGLESEWEEI